MGQKLDFNIEDAGLKIDGTAAIGSDASYSGTLNSDKITSATVKLRLAYINGPDTSVVSFVNHFTKTFGQLSTATENKGTSLPSGYH